MATPPADAGIQESDKPFLLALIGTAGLLGIGFYGIFTGKWSEAKDFLAILSPLVVMSWSFYYKSKT